MKKERLTERSEEFSGDSKVKEEVTSINADSCS